MSESLDERLAYIRKKVLADGTVTPEEYVECLELLRDKRSPVKPRPTWLVYHWLHFCKWCQYMLAKIGK